MAHADLISAHRHHQALDQIFKLAHVARPCMIFKHRKRIGGHPLDWQSVGHAVYLKKILAEQGNIAAALP